METSVFNFQRWQTAINESFRQFADQIATYAPQIVSSLAILIFGWLIASILSVSAKRLVQGLDLIFNRLARSGANSKEQIRNSYAVIVGKVVFWVTIVFFATVSANVLGWEMFTRWMDSIVGYLPGLLTGLLIIMAGFLLSNFVKTAIMTASLKAGVSQSAAMSRSVQIIILFSAIIIGVEQIGLSVDFLSSLIVVVAGTLLAGASLAFGLGAQTMVANLLGAQYSRKHCRMGETMKIGDIEGEILEITQSNIVLDTGSGRAVIPAKLFHEMVSVYTTAKPDDSDNGEQSS